MQSRPCRECDYVCLLCSDRRKRHALRLRDVVFTAQMPISFHRQRAAVFVSEPARNCWNIHSRFDTPCCKQMPQIMVRDAFRANFLGCAIKRLLAFARPGILSRPKARRHAHCAFVEIGLVHRESAEHGAIPNSSYQSSRRRGQRFRQRRNPHHAKRSLALHRFGSRERQAGCEICAVD